MERWHRRDINKAPYNPRTIDDYARKKLERVIKKVGLLETLVVNRTTRNLLSGHQRITILDAFEGTDDYYIDVSVCELTEKQEREQNIFFNNPSAQGQYDNALLAELLPDLDLDNTGFEMMDLEVIFDPEMFNQLFDPNNAPNPVQDASAKLKEIDEAGKEERRAALKARREEFKKEYNDKLETEFYSVVVFPSRDECDRFLMAVKGRDDDRYVDGRLLAKRLDVDLTVQNEAQAPQAQDQDAAPVAGS